ncbi:MAG: hypothetical protein HFF11_10680 [Angelakisella sp.]|jgi:hypothetical protein|nr:hypothetical protein [Angelakisella sp.]
MEDHVVLNNQTPKLGEGDTLPPRRLNLELPQGLLSSLALSPEAAGFFAGLDTETRGQIVAYIQSTVTGEEARARARTAMEGLEAGRLDFLHK